MVKYIYNILIYCGGLIMKKYLMNWEIIGTIIIIIMGTLLHFTFEWFNYWRPIALISAVNESVWEHLKIGFWPALIFSIIEYVFVKKYANNFIIAKAACLTIIPIVIIVIFYSYTSIIGHNILTVDISTFIVAIALGQYISYKILTTKQLPTFISIISLMVVILLIVAFSLFTYYTIHLPIFRDMSKGKYGI